MLTKSTKQGVVWGGTLILAGVLSLVNQFVEISPWAWVVMLAGVGAGAFVLYLTDRSDWAMLLTTYIEWAIALLIALVMLDILRDEAIAFYVLCAIALPFLVVFLRDRAQWWALIPAYILLAVGLMVWLIGLGILGDLLIPAYVLVAIAVPFLATYLMNRSQWWALIPGGIIALIGLSFLIAEGAARYLGALALIVVGVGILLRVFSTKAPAVEAVPPDTVVPAAPEPEVLAAPEVEVPAAPEPEVDEPPVE